MTLLFSNSLPTPAMKRLFALQRDRRVPTAVIQVPAWPDGNGGVECGNGPGCKGRFGKILGVWLNPGPGWKYLDGEPVALHERGEIYFGEFGLANGTWLPRRNACRRWYREFQQSSRPSASLEFRRRVAQGLAPYARSDTARGWDWDSLREEIIPPPGAHIPDAAVLPLRIVCFVCLAVNEVSG